MFGKVRVLFADDQIPSENDTDNERARDEIVKELASKLPNVRDAYEEDHRWFKGLHKHLSQRQSLTVIPAKRFEQAEQLLQKRELFDVAVIDLSWHGEPSLRSDQKIDAGFTLLKRLAEDNRDSGDYKPAIAYSQNFKADLELVAKVLEAGALPIQKDYSELGYRTLSAAIRLLAYQASTVAERNRERATQVDEPLNPENLKIREVLDALTVPQMWKILATILTAAGALAGAAFWLGSTLGS